MKAVADRPPLSILVTVREGLEEARPVLEAASAQARATGAEILVVGRVEGPVSDPVRLVPVDDLDLFRLRQVGLREARGDVVAIGEDHAIPRPDWCEAVIRAHAERPEAPAIAGCLVNATDRTLSGRANFLAFAAPFQPPPAAGPHLRPPPVSALSVKREALAELDGELGRFECDLVPRLWAEGGIVLDDRVVVDHYQDHGLLWAIANGFHGPRAAYGYGCARAAGAERRRLAWWALRHWPRRIFREAREATRGERRIAELSVVAAIGAAMGVGAAVGCLAGPGRSPKLVA